MNRELAMKIANAVLYEGYLLYPYRPSAIKNRQRWSFGILYPPAYEDVRRGTERSYMHSECLLRAGAGAQLTIQLRFLHLLTHEVLQAVGDYLEPAASLVIDGRLLETRDEAMERSVQFDLEYSGAFQQQFDFRFDSMDETESLHNRDGRSVGEIRRSQDEVHGTINVCSQTLQESLLKLSLDVRNTTVLPGYANDRDSALLASLLSAHTMLTVSGGEFISLLEPPDELRSEVKACNNIGNFPVLVGDTGGREMILCSPILLYDYPQIAPESAGDFYDATEMDEMLTLRVLTLTDEEKDEMRSGDDRVRNLLQRTEQSAREQLTKTHGTIRSLRPASDQ